MAAGLAVIAVLAFAWAPAAAQADLTWSAAATLSPSGTSADQMQVATDAAGDAIAVWVQNDPQAGVTRIAEETRKAGGAFSTCSTPCWVSDQYADAESPSIAINASGQALVTWSTNQGTGQVVLYATGSVNGGFGNPNDDQDANALITSTTDTYPQAGIDAAGDDFIAAYRTLQESGNPGTVIAYDRLAGASTFNVEAIDYQPATGFTFPFSDRTVNVDEGPRIAVNPAGAVLVTWTEQYQENDPDVTNYTTNIVEASYRAAGGNGGDGNLQDGFSETPQLLSPPAPISNEAVPALDSSGNGIVAFVEHPASNGPNTVQAAYRPVTTTDSGSFDTATVLSDPTVYAFTPDVAFDASGNAIAAWEQYPSPTAGFAQVEVSYRPAGRSFGSAVVTSAADVDDGPAIGVDSEGRETVEWDSYDPTVSTHDHDIVEAATRDGGNGAFSTPTKISQSLNLDTVEGVPQLSVSSAGQAVAVWHYQDDQGDTIAQAVIGTLPGSTPPPPPPPPPPPVPNVIVPAAPIQGGKAIVLTADVADASRVLWQFDGGGPNILGTKIGGVLQNSVRLHWFQRTLTVKATVMSPSGTHTYSREFKLPSLSADKYSRLVEDPVSKSPRVFATGDAATLLGNTACGPVSLYSGDQQSSGCMHPVDTVNDIPPSERGVIDSLAASLGLDPSDPQLMNAAVQQLDGYVAIGPDTLNDTWPVTPHGSAKLMSFPGVGALTSSNASLNVGGLNLGGLSGGFSLHIDPGKLDIPLGSLPKPSLPDIGGFPLIGDWNVDLGTGDATIDTHLQLPSWINIGGIPLQVPISFHATPGGLVLDKINIGPIDVNIGPLAVKKFKLTYDRASDTWTGSGEVCLLTQACLDMSPPDGEIKIVHGSLNYAGATLVFPPDSGIPLFTGVNLYKIGFGLGLDPTRIIGRGAIDVLNLVNLDGQLVTAFPTAGHPFILARDEVGSDFPASMYGPPFTEPTIGASADVQVTLPAIGNVTLGTGYLLYEVPDYIALGGGVNITLANTIQIYGNVGGEANFSDRTLNLHAEAGACLLVIHKLCASAAVNVSRAPDDGGGAGGCIDVGGLHIGGGVIWKGLKVVVWPFDGCKWSRFKVDVRPSIANAAASSRTITVRRGAPNPALELHGDGAAPLVRVTGPGGQQLDSTDSGFDHSPGGHIRILRYESPHDDFTVVGLENAQPGRYTVSTLPGSVPFTEIDSATDLPDAHVTASIGGTSVRRTLSYDVRDRPGQSVTFWDLDKGAAATAIGHVDGGGKGEIHFGPAPGNGRRTIVAQFTLDGLPAERITVAHYQPPSPILATPRGLHVTRTKNSVKAGWHAVPGAIRYEVVLTDRTTGYQRLISTRRSSIALKGLSRTVGGTLTVRAVDQLRQSLPARAAFKRLAAPASRFVKLGRCKVAKRKITCTGGPATKKPKKRTKPKRR